LFIYWCTYLFPRNKNKWVFGAWKGSSYSDNPRYLFEYINKNNPNQKAVWIAKNKDLVRKVRNLGYKSYYAYSLLGIWHQLSAKNIVVCTDHKSLNDLVAIFINKKARLIQLWHGIGLKKIEYDNEYCNNDLLARWYFRLYSFSLTRLLMRVFVPYLCQRVDMLPVTSKKMQDIFIKSFRLPREIMPILGTPRASILLDKKKSGSKSKPKLNKRILYAPTFRSISPDTQGKDKLRCKGKIKNDIKSTSYLPDVKILEKINTLMQKLKANFVIRLHPRDRDKISLFDLNKFSNIQIDAIEDMQLSLLETDVLITDYSSSYFDYLLLNLPIIFAPFDLDLYLAQERGFYFDYDSHTPGVKASNWDELLSYIEKTVNGPDNYKKHREKLSKEFFKYLDGKDLARILKELGYT
jgi:CDP-glycerol glycerophosphotransferase (TagB/SpsB family)